MRIWRAEARTQFSVAVRLALAAWAAGALLQLLLYVRASPYGGPFLLEWRKYFLYALYYDLMGVWLIALPFLLLWLLRPATRRATAVHGLQAALLALYLALSQLDHEVLRFLGIRLGASFLATYVRPETVSDSLFFDVLAADAGGPFLPIALLVLVPLAYLGWARRQFAGASVAEGARPRLWIALLILILPLAAPLNAWNKATGKFRLRKVEPVTFAIAVDAALGREDRRPPADLDRRVRAQQARWLAASADKNWRFPSAEYPYLRVPEGPPPTAEPRWNVIFIQLETFRGADMGFLGRRPSPTPFLDRLVASPGAASWTRALSFGPPSINGLFAGHCSAAPHSRRYMTSFTHAGFYCLPQALAKRGYRTEMFNAGDTDWDNGTLWLARWYQRLWRYPEAKEQDRPVFRAAARRIRQLGAVGPFLATVVSVSNHTPFRSRERRFEIARADTPQTRILNTTRYTDDVLREFIESLRGEPWFARTLIVIVGDHGFNMGEHDRRPGQQNLYRESTWVPLIVAGAHPRLPTGRQDGLASMLDIAPTLADLLGIREANPWQGHSLLGPLGPRALYARNRTMLAADTPAWSLVTDPLDGKPRLFDALTDWAEQRRDLAARHPRVAAALAARAREAAELNDHLLREGRIWPPPRRFPGV
ncbi:MAG TPA: sulfatase-like hydrolase/transferase [Allosphingosinicella sp.]|nr:sulfatase-like hydrolase/transferase [Allosphingosinicella sp.]